MRVTQNNLKTTTTDMLHSTIEEGFGLPFFMENFLNEMYQD